MLKWPISNKNSGVGMSCSCSFILPNVTLADEDASVMDGLGQADVEHLSLQTSVQEVLDLEAEHVIELHLGLVQHADAHQTTQERIALEQALRFLLVEREQITSSLADLGERVAHAPHLVLVAQTELADELELLIETLLTVGTTRCRVGLVVNEWNTDHRETSTNNLAKETRNSHGLKRIFVERTFET